LLGWLGPWGDAIVQHHERYDGKGYPTGLAGAEISRAGRIVSVADCYDTMTAARSYKKPMAVWAARRELAECAGGQFDPEIVRAFLSISLPRLLWRTGPVSFVIQLPFLWRLQEVGLQSVTAVTQGATVATVAAGVTALAAVGPVHGPSERSEPIRARAAATAAAGVEASEPVTSAPEGGPATPADPVPAPQPVPSPRPTPSPSDPIPTTGPSPTSGPRPSPTTGPRPSPEPSPTRTPGPLPIPVPSIPPLPLPTLSPLPLPLPLPLPTLPPLPLPLPTPTRTPEPSQAARAVDTTDEPLADRRQP
jgi:hypothetical protein